MRKVILRDLPEGGYVSADFDFDWNIVEIFRGLSSRRFNGDTKNWEIPKHVISELKVKLDLANVRCVDKSSEETVRIRITKNGFKSSCGDVRLNPITNRLLYLKRPRDGYVYARELEKYGYKVKVIDQYASIDIPETTPKIELYDYQKECMEFLRSNDYIGLVALDIGLGKTMVSAQSIYELGKGPVLIVAPSSLLYQWQRALKEFYDLDSDVITSKIKKDKRAEAFENSPIAITNYELLRTVDFKRQYALLILDEIHRVKNWRSKTSQTISNIVSKRVIGLTGTPIEKNLFELYNIIEQILPGSLGTLTDFKNRYILQDNWGSVIGYSNLEEVYERLQGIMFRKRKEDVLGDLPDLIEKNVFVQPTRVEKKIYNQFDGSIGEVARAKVFCSSSAMIDSDITHSSKEKELMQWVGNFPEKTVIFSQYLKEVKRMSSLFTNRPIFHIHGEIDKKERQNQVDEFAKTDDGLMIMTDAGTYGIDGLQVSDTLINMDLPYTYSLYGQRVGRLQRRGNDAQSVTVVNLFTEVPFDRAILGLINQRKVLSDKAIDGIMTSVLKNG